MQLCASSLNFLTEVRTTDVEQISSHQLTLKNTKKKEQDSARERLASKPVVVVWRVVNHHSSDTGKRLNLEHWESVVENNSIHR